MGHIISITNKSKIMVVKSTSSCIKNYTQIDNSGESRSNLLGGRLKDLNQGIYWVLLN